MEKENRFKLRISRIFRFSFRSCKSRSVSDVNEKAVFVPQQTPHAPSPKPRPFPSICRHSCPYPSRTVNDSCIVSARDAVCRYHAVKKYKVAEQGSPFSRVNARFCPPSSPLSPSPYYSRTEKTMRNTVKTKKKQRRKNQRRPLLRFSSQETNITDYDFYGGDWFSSDDEREGDDDDEVDTVLSSRSTTVSSDSSPKHQQRRDRRRNAGCRRRLPARSKKGHSFAVVKRSSNPYGDFRTSMVEMIVERQIFGVVELEKLLQCFLALNSTHHHGTILEVFKDICDTLFCNLSWRRRRWWTEGCIFNYD